MRSDSMDVPLWQCVGLLFGVCLDLCLLRGKKGHIEECHYHDTCVYITLSIVAVYTPFVLFTAHSYLVLARVKTCVLGTHCISLIY